MFFTYLDVFHVFKEVRLGVAVVGELHQVTKVFLGGKRLDQAGQDGGILMLHTLEERTGTHIRLGGLKIGVSGRLGNVPTSVLLRSPLMTASRMVCWTMSL